MDVVGDVEMQARQGRGIFGADMKVDDGNGVELPWNGASTARGDASRAGWTGTTIPSRLWRALYFR
jgi:hypothetical protein